MRALTPEATATRKGAAVGASTPEELQQLARRRVAEVAKTMGAGLTRLATELHAEITDAIPELRGDEILLELLRASTESNVETFLHVVQHEIPIESVRPPSAAIEYARRLAQRNISANALLRAYRIGQNRVLAWAVDEVSRGEPDREVAFAASRVLQVMTFGYVDEVAEQVVAEYESERERWLANRNTVRAAMLTSILSGADVELGNAENALGYRLRQHHLGLVVWGADADGSSRELRRLESLIGNVAEAVGAVGQPLFLPQDRGLAWAWLPLGRAVLDGVADAAAIAGLIDEPATGLRVALGRPQAAVEGFKVSHEEAVRAYSVATIAGGSAPPVTNFDDPAVQVSSILARDLDGTRKLVASSLGGLAADDGNCARLRQTLHSFLRAKSSYSAAAEVLHVHKNTVRYRVDRAAEVRGRSISEGRLNLELALTACQRLGTAVLAPGAAGQPRA